MQVPQIRTKRLILRGFRSSDQEPFFQMNSDKRVMEHFPSLLTRAASDNLIERIKKEWEDLGYGIWAVEVPKKAPFIGFIGLHLADFPAHFTPSIEIGFRLAYPFWSKGYGKEGALAVCEYAFTKLKLAEIVSFTAKSNWRSQKLMEAIGMKTDPAWDFDNPKVKDPSLQPHVLYKLDRATYEKEKNLRDENA